MRHLTRRLIALGAVTTLGTGGIVAVLGTAEAAPTSSAVLSSRLALGLSSNGRNLTIFELKTAKRTKALGQAKGLVGDARLVGIDQRPANRTFYGVGNQGGVYRINAGNGQVTKVSQLSVALQGTHFGVDFNPAADRLRVVSDTGQNLRHDVTQATATTAVDAPLAYDGTTATGVSAAAYTNNDNDPRTGSALFDLDTTRDQVVQQVPANSGALNVTGPFGPRQGPIAGFDIVSTLAGDRAASNTGYASLRPTSGGLATLYRVDLLSGRFTKVAKFNKDIADIALPQP
ncbi:DUF4394 domain-containing protein [Aeromicrobium wangtongii]|uniref:DUF4394 domain-containing protein n=1 Tax=Aeromicrobium wangtongii TaxID=2969247 RepID=A0ABY5M6Q5_9ACTN|nr:DUF4394 domain-containing protein [Aeromicrobium wangtongii]MCD9198818.1 DUF4394 domain-containing protein [Aeromicrobium wangtongii]UUP13142.1 DUF4394 domain-containing protein [Aeromicrobium wangtongii]